MRIAVVWLELFADKQLPYYPKINVHTEILVGQTVIYILCLGYCETRDFRVHWEFLKLKDMPLYGAN